MLAAATDRWIAASLLYGGAATLWNVAASPATTPEAGQLLFLQTAVAAALLLAVFAPAWRLPALAAGLLAATAGVASWWWSAPGAAFPWGAAIEIVLLGSAAAWLLAELRREARWEGMMASRQRS